MVQKVSLSMTEDIASEINGVSVAVDAVAQDLDDLDQSLGTASTRNVGTGAGDLVETSELDNRLGDYTLTADLYNATLVWSGSDSAPNIANFSEGGPGLYIVRNSFDYFFTIFVVNTSLDATGTSKLVATTGTDTFTIFFSEYRTDGTFNVRDMRWDDAAAQTMIVTNLITEVYKL